MFQKGNQFGSKSKRGKSKFNTELKEYLGDVSNNIIKEIDIKELSNYERIQFLRTILPYLIPKNNDKLRTFTTCIIKKFVRSI